MIDHACSNGLAMIRVSIFDRHLATRRLYRSTGFEQVVRGLSVAFGQGLRQVDFEKELIPPRREQEQVD